LFNDYCQKLLRLVTILKLTQQGQNEQTLSNTDILLVARSHRITCKNMQTSVASWFRSTATQLAKRRSVFVNFTGPTTSNAVVETSKSLSKILLLLCLHYQNVFITKNFNTTSQVLLWWLSLRGCSSAPLHWQLCNRKYLHSIVNLLCALKSQLGTVHVSDVFILSPVYTYSEIIAEQGISSRMTHRPKRIFLAYLYAHPHAWKRWLQLRVSFEVIPENCC